MCSVRSASIRYEVRYIDDNETKILILQYARGEMYPVNLIIPSEIGNELVIGRD